MPAGVMKTNEFFHVSLLCDTTSNLDEKWQEDLNRKNLECFTTHRFHLF